MTDWKRTASTCFALRAPCQLLQITDYGPLIVKLGVPAAPAQYMEPSTHTYAGRTYLGRPISDGNLLVWDRITGLCIGTVKPGEEIEDLVELCVTAVGGVEEYQLLLVAAALNLIDVNMPEPRKGPKSGVAK